MQAIYRKQLEGKHRFMAEARSFIAGSCHFAYLSLHEDAQNIYVQHHQPVVSVAYKLPYTCSCSCLKFQNLLKELKFVVLDDPIPPIRTSIACSQYMV